MLNFNVFASSSKGNLYSVSDDLTSIMIECGLPIKDIRKHFDFNMSNVSGCLITHEHKDHSKAAQDIMKAGIDLYCSKGTAGMCKLSGHRLNIIESGKQFKINSWSILPFESQHDAAEPLGFFIMNGSGERVLFLTDSYYCQYTFPMLDIIAVECNYSKEILNKNVEAGKIPEALKKRLTRSHFSLDNVINFFKANDLSRLKSVHLLHLSDSNSDEQQFIKAIQQITGCPVYANY